jgi:hypothetical protein
MPSYYCGGNVNKGSEAGQAAKFSKGLVQDETCTQYL